MNASIAFRYLSLTTKWAVSLLEFSMLSIMVEDFRIVTPSFVYN